MSHELLPVWVSRYSLATSGRFSDGAIDCFTQQLMPKTPLKSNQIYLQAQKAALFIFSY